MTSGIGPGLVGVAVSQSAARVARAVLLDAECPCGRPARRVIVESMAPDPLPDDWERLRVWSWSPTADSPLVVRSWCGSIERHPCDGTDRTDPNAVALTEDDL